MQIDQRTPLRILGIGGSMREGSLSTLLLQAALQMADQAGAETVLADVRTLDLPVYRPEWSVDQYPPTLAWLLEEARRADAYIFCSPTYHGTITGAVKNVLDALNDLGKDTPRYLGGKVVGLLALGGNAANVLNALHHTARGLAGLSAPTVVSVPSPALDPATGEVTDPMAAARLRQMVEQVIDLSQKLRRG